MIHRAWFGDRDGRAPLVLLHEGLGSVSSWGSFPGELADATGRAVLAADRRGYGRSGSRPGPWPASFLHDEAAALASLLVEERVDRPILVGHSDGASIALLYPSCGVPVGGPAPLGIVSLAAHVFVEPVCVEAITELRLDGGDELVAALARHHEDARALFDAWSEVWCSDRFRTFDLHAELGAVRCPVVAVQGAEDRFGTPAQLSRLAAAVGGSVETALLPDVDHWPHREATEAVLTHVRRLVALADPQ